MDNLIGPRVVKNYTEREKEILMGLVLKYKSLIENKKTDAVSNITKKAGWKKVHAEFNSQPHVEKRKVESLQKAWENIKKKRRQEISKECLLRMKTGGGTYDSPDLEDQPEFDSIIDSIDIEVKGVEDSDFFFSQSQKNSRVNGDIPITSFRPQSTTTSSRPLSTTTSSGSQPSTSSGSQPSTSSVSQPSTSSVSQPFTSSGSQQPVIVTLRQVPRVYTDPVAADASYEEITNLNYEEEEIEAIESEVNPPPAKKNRNSFYGSRVNAIDEESNLRKKRLYEQIKQDAELHKKRMELMEIELIRGKEKLESERESWIHQSRGEKEKAAHETVIFALQKRQEEAKAQSEEAKQHILEYQLENALN